jgi:lipoyl(octanoyl) transferase
MDAQRSDQPGVEQARALLAAARGSAQAALNAMPAVLIKPLGLADYEPVWRAMQAFTDQRDAHTLDEIWVVEHPPVYTLGQAGKWEHVLAPGDIPVVPVDRGGQVTYHGPGQLVVYPLLDLRRLGIGVRKLVDSLEQAVIDTLRVWSIHAQRREGAPGVYVDEAKIMALGLRVRRGCSFHGLALNVAMDTAPYERINPCGFRGLDITQISALGGPADLDVVAAELLPRLIRHLGLRAA